jgi:hypothetical protein
MDTSTNGVSEFSDGLKRIRQRRRLHWIIFFGFIPYALILSFVISLFTDPEEYIAHISIPYMLLFGLVGSYSCYNRCPRCDNIFSIKGYVNPWNRRCLHCKLHINHDKHAA